MRIKEIQLIEVRLSKRHIVKFVVESHGYTYTMWRASFHMSIEAAEFIDSTVKLWRENEINRTYHKRWFAW